MMEKSNIFALNDFDIEPILRQYERNEQSLKEDISTLRAWMQTQRHLPEVLDDKRLRNFLILNKFSIEKAKAKIDNYYTIRAKIPDVYENVNPSGNSVKEHMDIYYSVPLPKLTKEKYRVWVFKPRRKELVDVCDPYGLLRLMLNQMEVRLQEDLMFGDIYIHDMKDLTPAFALKLNPSWMSKALVIYSKVLSTPMKASYVVNCAPFVKTMINILKSVMKPKLFDRIHVCDDTSILNEHLSKDILPKEFGGDEQSLEDLQMLWKDKFNEYQDRFDQLDTFKVDESLRPEKLTNDETLGFYGNFKQLNVD